MEKDINLAISKKIVEVLEGKQIHTIMTRIDDKGLYKNESSTIREKKKEDMNNRLNTMKNKNADLFISIHMNSFEKKSANGLHVFYSQNHKQIEPLAKEIQNKIADITGAKTHAVKYAEKGLFLMKNPPIPAILIECGFLSNPEEEIKLQNDEYQSKIAWALGEVIENYYK